MSNLIIMPDASGGFPEDAKVRADYTGRVLALNIDKGKVFQSHRFYLGPAKPFATVPADANMKHISEAVLRGQVIDVTDQHGNGIVHETARMSAVTEIEDPSLRKVFIGVQRTDELTPAGQGRGLFIAVPKDEEEEREMLEQLQKTGRIDGKYAEQDQDVTMGPIQVSDVPKRFIANAKKETSWTLFLKAIKMLGRELKGMVKK